MTRSLAPLFLIVSLLLLSKSCTITYSASPELQARIEAAIAYRNSSDYIASRNAKQLRLHTLRERIYFTPSCHKRRAPDSYVPPYPRTFYNNSNSTLTYNPNIVTAGSRPPLSMTRSER